MNAVLRPVFTVADESLIRFVIYAGRNDDDHAEFDDFEVSRKDAAYIVRKHHAAGSYIERHKPGERDFRFYIEPYPRPQ